MSISRVLLNWLQVETVGELESLRLQCAAEWASGGLAWPVLIACGLAAVALTFYWSQARVGGPALRIFLGLVRATLLGLLVFLLADPVLQAVSVLRSPAQVWVLFDGSESMAIRDEDPEAAPGLESPERRPSRMDRVRAFVQRPESNWLRRLSEHFSLRLYLLDGNREPRALELDLPAGSPAAEQLDARARTALERVAEGLTTQGPVTALGSGLSALARLHGTERLAGAVVFSDFDENAGRPGRDVAATLGVPIHAVGIGPESSIDLALDLWTPPVVKKSERSQATLRIRCRGLTGRHVEVLVHSRDADSEEVRVVGRRIVQLEDGSQSIDLPFTPDSVGPWRLIASAEVLSGEVLTDNNRVERDLVVRDDFLRLLFVEYEPTWEWRFIKEVFHRDRLVGERGFKTFLASADPRVRRAGGLFLGSLTPSRSEFFSHDVIILGDLPASLLKTRFCSLVQELVGKFGGGLVILAGPRFGPTELLDTPIRDMLPVVLSTDSRLDDTRPFRPAWAEESASVDFLQLGSTQEESRRAWSTLGVQPWYWPVTRLHPLATPLVVHPKALCVDGETRQPVIAMRRYGRGEVVWFGFNETWRLRRGVGERHYRQLWGQLMYRLGLRHAVGDQKRFTVRSDRAAYRTDETAVITVEAYDQDYRPLVDLPDGARELEGEWIAPAERSSSTEPLRRRVELLATRDGIYEGQLRLTSSGEHRVRVRDPLTSQNTELRFRVEDRRVERASTARDTALERDLAERSGGSVWDLSTVDGLIDELPSASQDERHYQSVPVGRSWAAFSIFAGLLLLEWMLRRRLRLP